jgi:ketosteroid isomerase-like protein
MLTIESVRPWSIWLRAAHPSELARRFFEAYGAGELDAVRSALAPGLVAYVTNAEGGVDLVEGRDAYMERLPDLHATGGCLAVTQVLEVDAHQVLTMVEIRASRGGRELHNFAAFLARVEKGLVTHLWMVEALPAYSHEFWS